jgi:hyperpolarization activated cyclic nucleotide-gated potassium channel 1
LVDDKAFVVRVVPLLKPLFMLENEYEKYLFRIIWEEKSNPDAIYLLDYGRVNFKTDFIV